MEQEEAHVGNQKVTNLFRKMKGVQRKDFVKNEELLNEVYLLMLTAAAALKLHDESRLN